MKHGEHKGHGSTDAVAGSNQSHTSHTHCLAKLSCLTVQPVGVLSLRSYSVGGADGSVVCTKLEHALLFYFRKYSKGVGLLLQERLIRRAQNHLTSHLLE